MEKRAIVILYDGITPSNTDLNLIVRQLSSSNTVQANNVKVIIMSEQDIAKTIVSKESFPEYSGEHEKTDVEYALIYLKEFFKLEWSKPELILQKVADIENFPIELKSALEIISNKPVSMNIRRNYEYKASVERVLKLVEKLINK